MLRELDIVLFGATGFTGKSAIPFLFKFITAKNINLKWGIAGRSKEKLQEVLTESERKLGTSLSNIPILCADVANEESLQAMARKTRLLINCVGPYRFYGDPVVKACTKEHTHYIDTTGEPQFIETTALKYHKSAQETGIFIVNAAGFDSAVADLGVLFLQKNFGGVVNSVQCFLEVESDPTAAGPLLNYATWQSAVHGMLHVDELKEIRKKLYKPLPKLEPQLRTKLGPSDVKEVKGWILPSVLSDRTVLRRTQHSFYNDYQERPVQVECYRVVKTLTQFLGHIFYGKIIQALSQNPKGTNLLLKYPDYFTAGTFKKQPLTEKCVNSTWFKMTIYGEGWKEPVVENSPLNQSMCVEVTGTNPGYGTTNILLVLSAIQILTNREKLPTSGGVYTSAHLFRNTSIIEELHENNVNFNVLSKQNLELKAKY